MIEHMRGYFFVPCFVLYFILLTVGLRSIAKLKLPQQPPHRAESAVLVALIAAQQQRGSGAAATLARGVYT